MSDSHTSYEVQCRYCGFKTKNKTFSRAQNTIKVHCQKAHVDAMISDVQRYNGFRVKKGMLPYGGELLAWVREVRQGVV